jgi:UDP-glucose 4-epimerase
MRVLVTGGAGFIGHHLVQALSSRGSRVLVIDDLSSGRADWLPTNVELETLDVAVANLDALLARWRPAIVYHLAAQVSVPRSQADPEHDLRVNGLGTLRLIGAARPVEVRRLVFMSSGGAVYGETMAPATEQSTTRPESFYGVHKLLAERYVALSRLSYAIARPSNVYGPGQAVGGDGAVVPAFVHAVREAGPVTIHGDGRQRRDFVHVEDVVAGLLLLGRKTTNGIWNIAKGEATTILELAELLDELTGRPSQRQFMPRRPGDVYSSLIASTRLVELGWAPRYRLRDGLRELLRGAGSAGDRIPQSPAMSD